MNVFYIGFDIEGVGGIATYSRYQIQALRQLGHRVHVLSVNKQALHVKRGLIDRNMPFVNKYSTTLRLARRILRERRRFDLVLFNHVYLAVAGYAARLLGGPAYAMNVYNIDILETLPLLRERAFAGAALVIADCQYTIDRLPRFHARVPPTGLLYDPVDTEFFRPIPRAEARREVARRLGFDGLDGKFIATTVANMILPPNKGHRQTIEALRKLNDPRYLYVVVGEGPDRLPIADYAAQNGVAGQVKFTGLVDQSALPYLYAAADV
ncbi:MAG: glycosyltransferase family 4 protein, partial [Proteobacteria bacterium]|nr:glycosyltransferase family 4 protein [Pseudomonadota bacterium]